MIPQIIVDRNYVVIQGVKVERQSSISPMQWLEFWEKDEADVAALEARIEDLEDQVKDLERDVEDANKKETKLLKKSNILKPN